ncbi:MAG: glycosyltransferase family 2 protein [Patescibacteria group bacterium]|nr:glycosyltransferase family 2 protein [bacterium]MDZ4240733.1 glycosyltransferase family 2 protein [Patescibacteria group bacterium]
MNRKLSVIVPVFNEEKTVGVIIERLLAVPFVGWDTEIIAVNDGSSDNSLAILESFSSRIKIINLSKNGGKGNAVKTGIDVSTGDYAIIQDADLECKPEEIPLLLSALKNVSQNTKIAVMGSRELRGARDHKSQFLPRFGSVFITKLINFLYSTTLTDTLMGYKLFPKSTFGYFDAGGFESEMLFLVRLLEEGYRILEIPVSYIPRSTGEGKKIKYRHGIKIIFKILTFWLKNRFMRKRVSS